MIRRYTLPGMGAVWSEQARFERMLEVEIAVCRAQVRRGLVPAEALAVIEARAVVDVDRINEIEATTDHDVIAFVSQVAEAVGPEGRFLHLGLTSSDVVDTALALQLRAAGERLAGGRGRPARRADRPRPPRGRHRDDGPHPLRPRGADDVRAEVRGLGLRGGPRTRAPRRGDRGDRHRQDQRPGGDLQPPGPGRGGGGARGPRPARGPGQHADRPAGPPRGLPGGDRDPRRHARAARDGGAEPPAHRDRGGHGAVQARPEGLVGDAPQAQPDPVGADRGAGPAPPRLRADGRSRTSRCGTSATSATAPPSA